jgi:hypothetical protein
VAWPQFQAVWIASSNVTLAEKGATDDGTDVSGPTAEQRVRECQREPSAPAGSALHSTEGSAQRLPNIGGTFLFCGNQDFSKLPEHVDDITKIALRRQANYNFFIVTPEPAS